MAHLHVHRVHKETLHDLNDAVLLCARVEPGNAVFAEQSDQSHLSIRRPDTHAPDLRSQRLDAVCFQVVRPVGHARLVEERLQPFGCRVVCDLRGRPVQPAPEPPLCTVQVVTEHMRPSRGAKDKGRVQRREHAARGKPFRSFEFSHAAPKPQDVHRGVHDHLGRSPAQSDVVGEALHFVLQARAATLNRSRYKSFVLRFCEPGLVPDEYLVLLLLHLVALRALLVLGGHLGQQVVQLVLRGLAQHHVSEVQVAALQTCAVERTLQFLTASSDKRTPFADFIRSGCLAYHANGSPRVRFSRHGHVPLERAHVAQGTELPGVVTHA